MLVTSPSQKSIPLSEVVRVRESGLRSINVEYDLNSQKVIEGYVLTAQAINSFNRILAGLINGGKSRAWTLTGPYGSGKSYFGLFLMNLLCKDQSVHSYILNLVNEIDNSLVNQIKESIFLKNNLGLLPIPVTGYRASIQECIKHGIEKALHRLTDSSGVQKALIDISGWSSNTNTREILAYFETLFSVAKDHRYQGIVLVFDELGKALEYSATQPDDTDIYLLQALAELANRSGETPFLFIGILHQAFEHYAVLMDGASQREWSKVQGRFEDIAFQEPPHQQMRLLVNALEISDDVQNAVVPYLHQAALDAAQAGWCPPMLQDEGFIKLCESAYPLHPTVLAALPYLFKRLAQNERSIFAYLASHEPYGFQEFLHNHQVHDLIRLPNLFDYLAANFQARLYASGRTRTITETLERLSNANGLLQLETDLLKTIGLLNWLGEVSPLQAKQDSLFKALESPGVGELEINQALERLKNRSQIVYRRYNNSYRVWQGSDVDIEERIEEAQRQISGAFSLAEEIQRLLPHRPIVARRHTYLTGSLRYFNVQYVDVHTQDLINLQPTNGADGTVLLCLPASIGEFASFLKWAEDKPFSERQDLIIGIIQRTNRLFELLHELRCLHWVNLNTPELRDDIVARRELQTRIAAMEVLALNEMERAFSTHRLASSSTGRWFNLGKEVSLEAHQGLTHLLSNVCDGLYHSTPRLWNELINRRALSSQGAAARRNLLERIIEHSDKEKLGIEGFPPERSMYASVLAAGGLHRNIENQWKLQSPPPEDPLKLQPAWEEITEFIFKSPPEPRSVKELSDRLNAPPYGIFESVFPVLLSVFLQVHKDETTLYREGTLIAEPDIPDWEVLVRRPELFSVAGCRVTGNRAAMVNRIARGWKTAPRVMPIVRTLVGQMLSLPEYARRTQQLSPKTIALRRAIETARSPEQLLFQDLPKALECQPIPSDRLDPETLEEFFAHLNRALAELNAATPGRRDWARDTLLEASELPLGLAGWQTFIDISKEMRNRVNDPSLAPLIKRVTEATDPATALESAIAYIANRPLRNWGDSNVERFPGQAQGLGQKFVAERNGYLPNFHLTSEEVQTVEILMKELQRQLGEYKDKPHIIQVALQQLLNLHKSDNSTNES